jgi:hypothetical protein
MEIARKTQLALLKSAFVLQAAIRDPAISELEVVAIQPDPLAWLANRLQTEFIQGSEILQLRMVCAEDEVEEYRKVVDAVANAYQEQVVFAGRNQQLAVRDTLRKQLAKLNGELRRKMEDYNALAKDLGALDGESQVGQQLNMARIERIESEILRLENEALLHELRGEEGKEAEVQSKYFETRLTRLAEQRAQLEEQMKGAMEPSVELNLRRTEIEQLQEVARDVAMRIERLDLQSQHSNPIVKIQDAAASRLSDSDQQVLNVIRVPGGLK